VLFIFARETAGATRIRHSLRPLCRGQLFGKLGRPRRENAEVWLSQIRHRERSEAIQLCV